MSPSAEPSATERVHVTRSRARPGGSGEQEGLPFRHRKPPWLKVPAPGGTNYRRLKKAIDADNLHTVCQEANCPNVGECWERGTATFMILGDVTSVDRDDLPDYGASDFVGVIRSIRMLAPGCKVEVLTPDFRGQEMPIAKVIHERPDVFNHNVETVPRLYPKARRGSDFTRSCRVLRLGKEMGGGDVVTKSGLTVGQYLRPTESHLPVERYWHPDEFAALEKAAYELGFESVASGPLVRSSYHADEQLPEQRAA